VRDGVDVCVEVGCRVGPDVAVGVAVCCGHSARLASSTNIALESPLPSL
jgi:hypothetical protein